MRHGDRQSFPIVRNISISKNWKKYFLNEGKSVFRLTPPRFYARKKFYFSWFLLQYFIFISLQCMCAIISLSSTSSASVPIFCNYSTIVKIIITLSKLKTFLISLTFLQFFRLMANQSSWVSLMSYEAQSWWVDLTKWDKRISFLVKILILFLQADNGKTVSIDVNQIV